MLITMDKLTRKDIDRILYSALRAVYRFEREKVDCFGLTYQEIYLLQYLIITGQASISRLSNELKVPLFSASRIVARLEDMRLVHKEKDPSDRRSTLVSLTEEGIKTVSEVEEHTFRIVTGNLSSYDYDTVRTFINTALHLKDILNVEDR